MKAIIFWMLLMLLILLGMWLYASNTFAYTTEAGHVHYLLEKRQVFVNKDCAESDTCGLKNFSVTTQKYEVWFPDEARPSYGTKMIAGYETGTIGGLENYVIVQFVRGCIFDTLLFDGNKNYFGHVKDQFGKLKTFCFPDWIIDSIDTDPVYWSVPGYPRHNFYRRGEPLSRPILFVQDHPTGAFSSGITAVNASLEFKTCIFKSKDAPLETDENDVNFADPIKCFEWAHSYIYNPATGKYEPMDKIHPFCFEKPPPY